MKRTIESLTPPENKQVMWLDVSGKVKQLKVYINGEWVVVNDDTENNEEIVKKVLEKLGFEVSIAEDESIVATAEEDNIDDTTHVVVDHEEVQVYGELLGNFYEMDEEKAITFTEFMQAQLLEDEYALFRVVGTESRICGVIDVWSYAICITKKAHTVISLSDEINKFLAGVGGTEE